MLCEKCGKNHASTHIKTVVNGVVKEYYLCSVCAAQSGYAGNGISGILASFLGEASHPTVKIQKKCSLCGATLNDIAKNGKIGCSECYKTFKDELIPYIKRIHGATMHVGKTPDLNENITNSNEKTLKDLRQELLQLVSQEKYEQAAVVRDKIKEIEGKANE